MVSVWIKQSHGCICLPCENIYFLRQTMEEEEEKEMESTHRIVFIGLLLIPQWYYSGNKINKGNRFIYFLNSNRSTTFLCALYLETLRFEITVSATQLKHVQTAPCFLAVWWHKYNLYTCVPLLCNCAMFMFVLLQEMWDQEKIHLEKFNEILAENRVRPTALLPLWNVAGFMLG